MFAYQLSTGNKGYDKRQLEEVDQWNQYWKDSKKFTQRLNKQREQLNN
jgi:hypothetical protein